MIINDDKIIEHFGAEFYNKVIANLPKYAERWDLSNFEQIDYYSLSCLFTCVSTEYDACVLKFGTHLDMVEDEYHMLKDYDGNGLCKVYEVDVDNGVLLIERITPGTQLCEEPNQNIRIDEFCLLFQKLHKPSMYKDKYLTYMERASEVVAFIKTRSDYVELYHKMVKAEEILHPLWEKYTKRLLLHGDLHHENILLGKDGYCAIDPVGIIGDPVFDISMFIIDEVDWDKEGNYDYIVRTISEKLDICEKDIRALVYAELCLLNCLFVEDGEYDEVDLDEIILVERMMNSEAV